MARGFDRLGKSHFRGVGRMLGLLLGLLYATMLPAQTTALPDTALVGVYVTSLYDLNLAERSFNIDFWLWFNYPNDSLHPMETVEIANAKDFSFDLPDTARQAGMTWANHKCHALVKKEWDLRHFPFDRQRLDVRIEDAIIDATALCYLPDSIHSNYDRSIKLDEWIIQDFKLRRDDKRYETNFGNPSLAMGRSYPAVTASFEIRRNGLGLFFKLFVGVYVAYIISLMVFWMGPESLERFGLIVGALFAGVANKYIVDGLMPPTIIHTLPDKIHNVTFVYIILHLILTVIVSRLAIRDRIKTGWRLDLIAFSMSLASYLAINFYLVYEALNYL